MSEQAMAVPVAVEGVEPRVATTGPVVVPVVDRGLVAQLVGEAQRQGLPVDGEEHVGLGQLRARAIGAGELLEVLGLVQGGAKGRAA